MEPRAETSSSGAILRVERVSFRTITLSLVHSVIVKAFGHRAYMDRWEAVLGVSGKLFSWKNILRVGCFFQQDLHRKCSSWDRLSEWFISIVISFL